MNIKSETQHQYFGLTMPVLIDLLPGWYEKLASPRAYIRANFSTATIALWLN